MSILIVEDEKKLVDILKIALKGERYSVDVAYDGEDGLAKATKNNYSLILLDIMLPKKDGLTICRELRAREIHTPIIMLTARGSEEDRVEGLNAGADDYLIKPFGLNELFARIRAVLRRRKKTDSDVSKVADLVMDRKKHEVTRSGVVVPLTPKEYKLLDILLSNYGEAINRRKLIDHAWGPSFEETNNELNVHIKYLRNKIDGNKSKSLIHTIRGVGFILKE
ncbi:MAG: DNA-binding response regulator [Candidatus Zambryskibacteria bacterium RIFOXYD1_FULL_40_13]|uniref:DNA-binding response regulator n=1 Tax=candidate division WWE3 bacterium RIFOXYC1_FULL_39_7 TaxID=1802643 RepID=A0A1F4WH02_UNCKA|nr:MAG: Response regulator receiver domain protein (CheY-like) [Parcubacteria group bacterium GW2011_GWC1_39_12]KKR19062.1 MAG: Response regulator receiver domain protein (CheY-like) [Parcubacteria group bacterium GW2011_GWF1_39_37]KKR35629.1 MAG: Response regulator receiver domain protein (CheY-like) [Parcubacteria group bacterium GW2011_GWC2_40_10]KKR52040.1 MAG: Response regulator receiver domain protein (CheY-like) [Parcubacteria group bacterium GW2011_GWE1_40_20]KKR65351.1 MAG: Response re